MTKPDDILSLFREMSVQETPEAAATAALAWALRHAPVDGGALEISGHRIERIAPEPDPWPTAPLIVASVDGGGPQLLSVLTTHSAATMTSAIVRRSESTLTNVVPVTVVPTAEWEALVANPQSWTRVQALIAATDALGVDL